MLPSSVQYRWIPHENSVLCVAPLGTGCAGEPLTIGVLLLSPLKWQR